MGKGARLKRERKRRWQLGRLEGFVDPPFLLDVRRKILESGARRDSCILSTKIVCELAQQFGLRAKPLTVETTMLNAPAAEIYLRRGGVLAGAAWDEIAEAKGHLVILGWREDPVEDEGMWAGHLVAHVDCPGTNGYVIDLSADQGHRPEKGILVPGPICFPLEQPGFLRGNTAPKLRADNGSLVGYDAHPEDRSYEDSKDWSRPAPINVHITKF